MQQSTLASVRHSSLLDTLPEYPPLLASTSRLEGIWSAAQTVQINSSPRNIGTRKAFSTLFGPCGRLPALPRLIQCAVLNAAPLSSAAHLGCMGLYATLMCLGYFLVFALLCGSGLIMANCPNVALCCRPAGAFGNFPSNIPVEARLRRWDATSASRLRAPHLAR